MAGGPVTLAAVLRARPAGLSEPEIWSLLCQAAQALQDLFLAKRAHENAPRVSPASLRLTSRGRVTLEPDVSVPWPAADPGDRYLAPEYGGGRTLRNTNEVDIEKMWIFSLGQSLREAVNTDKVELTRPLDNLLTVMTRADPRQRATLMDVLNVISDFCKVRLDCKPFSHVAMEIYRKTLNISPQATLVTCLSLPDSEKPKTVACNGKLGKSCSLKEPRAPRPLRRAPSHLYGVPVTSAARYACPNTRIGPEFVVRASEPCRTVHMPGGKRGGARGVSVVLLDGRRMNVRCDTTAVTAGQLLGVVCKVGRIEENFFLGLAALLDGDLFFLCADTRLCKAGAKTPGCDLTLHLRVKFYLPSLRGVARWTSKHLLYLQLRRCFLERQVRCDAGDMATLGGLALQAEFGDATGDEEEYFLPEHYVPEGMGALAPALRAQHRKRRGLDPGRAEETFITLSQSMEDYGLHFYAVEDAWLAVGGRGVALYDRSAPENRRLQRLYAWGDIDRLCHTEKHFVLRPRAGPKRKFRLERNKCLFVFDLASQHHRFFLRLRAETVSLRSLSREFGVSIANLGNKPFYVEDTPLGNVVRGLMPSPKHRSQTSLSTLGTSSSLDSSMNIEEHQNKENERPAFRRLNTELVITSDSLERKEQHTQCLPSFLQYPVGAGPESLVSRTDSNKTASFPRRHRVKMGTRAISGVPKELSASRDTHVSLSSACSHVAGEPPSPPCSPPPLDRHPLETRSSVLEACVPDGAAPLPRSATPLGHSRNEAPPLPSTAPPLEHSPNKAPPLPHSATPLEHSPHEAPPLPSTAPPLNHSYEAPPLLDLTPPPNHSPNEALPLPSCAYVLDSSLRSMDESFRLDADESLSDSLAGRFDEMSFADERILRAFTFARDGVSVSEGSDGGVYVRSGGRSPLRPGDQLVAVDGRSLLRMRYADAVDFLRTRGAELDVVVSRAVSATPTGMRAVCCVLPSD